MSTRRILATVAGAASIILGLAVPFAAHAGWSAQILYYSKFGTAPYTFTVSGSRGNPLPAPGSGYGLNSSVDYTTWIGATNPPSSSDPDGGIVELASWPDDHNTFLTCSPTDYTNGFADFQDSPTCHSVYSNIAADLSTFGTKYIDNDYHANAPSSPIYLNAPGYPGGIWNNGFPGGFWGGGMDPPGATPIAATDPWCYNNAHNADLPGSVGSHAFTCEDAQDSACGNETVYPTGSKPDSQLTANRLCGLIYKDPTAVATLYKLRGVNSTSSGKGVQAWDGSHWYMFNNDFSGDNNTCNGFNLFPPTTTGSWNAIINALTCKTFALPLQKLNVNGYPSVNINYGDPVNVNWDDRAPSDNIPITVGAGKACNPFIFFGLSFGCVTSPGITEPDTKCTADFNIKSNQYTYCANWTSTCPIFSSCQLTCTDMRTDTIATNFGTVTETPLQDTTYHYSCTNANGSRTVTATVFVNGGPSKKVSASLTPASQTVNQGSTVALNWGCQNSTKATLMSSDGVTNTTLSPVDGNTHAISGLATPAAPATYSKYYSLTCSDDLGNQAVAYSDVTVLAPSSVPNVSCSPDKTSGDTGTKFTYTASATGFSSPSLTYKWTNPEGTPTSQTGSSNTFASFYPAGGPYTASVAVSDAVGESANATCSPSVTSVTPVGGVCGALNLGITATPSAVPLGTQTTIKWSATGVTTSCTVKGPGVNVTNAANACVVAPQQATPTINQKSVYCLKCDAGAPKCVTVTLLPSFHVF